MVWLYEKHVKKKTGEDLDESMGRVFCDVPRAVRDRHAMQPEDPVREAFAPTEAAEGK
mgnify:FL=1